MRCHFCHNQAAGLISANITAATSYLCIVPACSHCAHIWDRSPDRHWPLFLRELNRKPASAAR